MVVVMLFFYTKGGGMDTDVLKLNTSQRITLPMNRGLSLSLDLTCVLHRSW